MTRARNHASRRKAGTAFASATAAYLARELGNDGIERREKNGAKDRGDITGVKYMGQRVVIECKDWGGRLEPGPWLTEAEVERGNDDAGVGMVVAKRRGKGQPGDQIVLMTLRDLAALMTGGREQP